MEIAAPAILIRPSTDDDVAAMLAIYRQHIRRGVGDLGSYEEDPLQAEDMKQRRKTMRKKRLPHLVAEIGGVVAGYAYAVPFRKRPAYRYTVKHSIYIHGDFLHAGIGRQLLPALIEACARAGYCQMIGYIDSTNAASLRLHEACTGPTASWSNARWGAPPPPRPVPGRRLPACRSAQAGARAIPG
jgi:L-amino acid N-acyltransferase YncA